MNFRVLIVPFAIPALFTSPVCYAQSRADRKEIKQLQADITYLSSDALEGRLTGSAGEQKAADYIQQRYKAEGIAPYKNQYGHPFHFVYGKEISGATQIKIGNNVLRMPQEAFPLPYSASKRASADLLPDVMEQGNVWVVALYSEQAEADNPHFDWRKSMHDRSAAAAGEGATGIVFYDGFGSKWAPVFDRQSKYEPLDIPAAYLSHDAYLKYVQQNNTADAATRDDKGGLQVELNIAIKKADRTGTNIAAYIDNNAPCTVVIGAHYDHLGRGNDGNDVYAGNAQLIYSGADENASGTAALLQIAGWLKKNKLHHYNYLFINFSGEEQGLIGSKAFIKEEKLDNARIAYMINMDMLGRLDGNTQTLTVGGVGTSATWEGIMHQSPTQLRIVTDNSEVRVSDHVSFSHTNIPVLYFFTGMNSDYHKPEDKADKINYTGEVAVIKYVQDVIKIMDKSPKPVFATNR